MSGSRRCSVRRSCSTARCPYGNLAAGELLHGDTYPLLAYLAYVPGALIAPVRDGFDSLDAALWVATAFALAAAAGAGARRGRPGWRSRSSPSRP